jgi:hypothetical protein
MCNLLPNGWRITQGTQPERKVLRLESRCYNKTYPGSEPTTPQDLMDVSLFLGCCKSSLDYPKYCLYIVHS